MLKKFKNIKPGTLITHVIITLAYPAAKCFRAERSRLLVFTDILTIVALILLIAGIVYGMSLRGYFDTTGYFVQRGFRSFSRTGGLQLKQDQSLDDYLRQSRERREDAFNYPLFLGLVYLLAAGILAFGVL